MLILAVILHYILDYFGTCGQFQAHFLEEVGTEFFRFAYQAQARFAIPSERRHHVHRAQVGQFVQHLPRTADESFALQPAFQGAPHGQGQKADQVVRLHALFFVVIDWS